MSVSITQQTCIDERPFVFVTNAVPLIPALPVHQQFRTGPESPGYLWMSTHRD